MVRENIMSRDYTDEKNVLILLSLLKQYRIKTIIASPGTTNATFVRSVQVDPYFKVYSAVDERSAAYMACGLSAESGEVVVLSCTGATASRNYLPGLTEAYYRKLPILAITSTRDKSRYGHLEDQVIDRTILPKDVAKFRVHLPNIKDTDDEWECRIQICAAILELSRNGGGPVHINLTTSYNRSYSTKALPSVSSIARHNVLDDFPSIPKVRIGIFIGSHRQFSCMENKIIDDFCESNNAVVFCDHTSGYKGKYGVRYLLPLMQIEVNYAELMPELLIHIGEISGFYHPFMHNPKEVWRVSEDGEIRDTFKRLSHVFEMHENHFFKKYTTGKKIKTTYFDAWQVIVEDLESRLPEIPFSNLWVAKTLSCQIPKGSNLHFGILNSLSSWNYFKVCNSVNCNSNVGGYGIDGCVSSLLGASLVDPQKLYFGFVGDLAFFYDMNSIGNRHLPKNLRLLVVNNGKGIEFKIKNNPATQFGEEIDEFIAAAGHFGNKSKTLIKDYASNLGFKYLSASTKEEFIKHQHEFLDNELKGQPVLFEVFTCDEEEDLAQKKFKAIEKSFKGSTKRLAREFIGDGSVNKLNKIFKR
jgi:2-succinyl-5-enolpyruvyl-6-hydroxy-3-cyclohexene-1-carboxylate synthase